VTLDRERFSKRDHQQDAERAGRRTQQEDLEAGR